MAQNFPKTGHFNDRMEFRKKSNVNKIVYTTHSPGETYELGASVGRQALPGAVYLFYGDLGAGKTAFIKGFASGVLDGCDVEATSPTYTYLNIYTGTNRESPAAIYHFDLYRLANLDQFHSMGFDEFLESGGFCCVEWAEKLAPLQLPSAVQVHMHHLNQEDARAITLVYPET